MLPSDEVPVRPLALTTTDGIRLSGDYRPAPARSGPLVVLCHGFTQRRTRRSIRRVLEALAGHVPLLTMDLRGHGRSAGRCTLGDEEVLDVAAAVAAGRAVSSPVEVVHRVAPIPLLLVHGDDDRYFGVEHAAALHRSGGGHGELWIEHDMGHGATGTSPALMQRIVGWARQVTEDTPIEDITVEDITVEDITVEQDGEAA